VFYLSREKKTRLDLRANAHRSALSKAGDAASSIRIDTQRHGPHSTMLQNTWRRQNPPTHGATRLAGSDARRLR